MQRISKFVRATRPAYRILFLYTILIAVVIVSTSNSDISSMLEALQTVFVALAAVGGLIVACEGLDTWHKQIRGRNDYDLAMKLGKEVLRLRDRLCAAGLMTLKEIEPRATNKEGGFGLGKTRAMKAIVCWKDPRFVDEIYSSMEELKSNHLEAELLWGEQAYQVILPVLNLAIELTNYIGYLNSKEQPAPMPGFEGSLEEIYKNKRNPIQDVNTAQDNEFQLEVKREAQKVRHFLSRFLGRHVI